jgi:hypothetical protein
VRNQRNHVAGGAVHWPGEKPEAASYVRTTRIRRRVLPRVHPTHGARPMQLG